ncbi:hypothetical protein AB1Y20_020758 [Prymnesium parvum]|uniref:RNA helicase n=1 Tax=Prymnesium parvum TaxID=97485 RepID=A0AB34JYJ2_PRYPA
MDITLDELIQSSGRGRGRGVLRGRGNARARGAGGAARGRASGKVPRLAGGVQKKAPPPRAGGKAKGAAKAKGGRGAGHVIVVGRPAGGGRRAASECLIGAETDIKAAAGFVCAGLRNDDPPVVKAISAHNVNQALKTLALVHSYLEGEHADLYAHVDFPEFSTAPHTASVALHVFKKAKRTSLAKVNEQVFVSGTSDPHKVATFVSQSVRQASLGRICVTACGPQAVLKALKAIFLARHHLREEQSDISVVPEFGKSEEGLAIVNIFCVSHRAGASI